jgi:pimeloyl-ACP methyl ester carboxylesterase
MMIARGQLDVAGCPLAYTHAGVGPPVLLVQGVGVHGEGWRPQLDALLPHFACLWYDNRGVGASQPAAGPITVSRLVEDAIALLDHRGWPSAHVIGHSLGGLIALRLALTDPARIRSLALLCTFARGRDAGASARMAWIGLRTRVGSRRMRRAAFLEILAPPGYVPSADGERVAHDLAPLFGHDLADHPAIEGQQLAAMRAEDTLPELGRLAGIPALVVSGQHDPIAPPRLGEQLARGIAGARFELLPDQAHGAPILAAATVNRLLLEHLQAAERVSAARPPEDGRVRA